MDTTPDVLPVADIPNSPAMATGIETHEGRPTRWLAVAFIALLLALGWLAGADDAVGSLLAGPVGDCGGP